VPRTTAADPGSDCEIGRDKPLERGLTDATATAAEGKSGCMEAGGFVRAAGSFVRFVVVACFPLFGLLIAVGLFMDDPDGRSGGSARRVSVPANAARVTIEKRTPPPREGMTPAQVIEIISRGEPKWWDVKGKRDFKRAGRWLDEHPEELRKHLVGELELQDLKDQLAASRVRRLLREVSARE